MDRSMANTPDFLQKVASAVALIREQVPACCRKHHIPEIDP